MWNIYEQPWTLSIIAVCLLVVVWLVNMFISDKKGRLLWLVPLVTTILALGLDFFVATDREKIINVIDTAVEAFEQEQPDEIAMTLDPDYKDSYHRNKQAISMRMQMFINPPMISKVYDSITEMEISGNTAELKLLCRIFFDENSDVASFTSAATALTNIQLNKNASGNWLINRIEVEKINGSDASWSSAKPPSY